MSKNTVLAVRDHNQARLSGDVASLLPSATAAVKGMRQRGTTFCPSCGGNKGALSIRCRNCRDALMRSSAAAARAKGLRSTGRAGAARSIRAEVAVLPTPEYQAVRAVRGEGTQVEQPKRGMLTKQPDGSWA